MLAGPTPIEEIERINVVMVRNSCKDKKVVEGK